LTAERTVFPNGFEFFTPIVDVLVNADVVFLEERSLDREARLAGTNRRDVGDLR